MSSISQSNNDSVSISRWVLFDEDANAWKCPECEEVQYFAEETPSWNRYNFCPYCGVQLINPPVSRGY